MFSTVGEHWPLIISTAFILAAVGLIESLMTLNLVDELTETRGSGAAPLIEQIPIAALVGVMFMVVIGTFAWSSFRIINKIPRADAFVLIAVSAITVYMDLAIAVIAGVIISALVFAWKNATMIRARKRMKDDNTKVYEIWGPLFFGSKEYKVYTSQS